MCWFNKIKAIFLQLVHMLFIVNCIVVSLIKGIGMLIQNSHLWNGRRIVRWGLIWMHPQPAVLLATFLLSPHFWIISLLRLFLFCTFSMMPLTLNASNNNILVKFYSGDIHRVGGNRRRWGCTICMRAGCIWHY